MKTREEWLNEAVVALRPIFEVKGYPIPDHVRVTCGFPSKHARSLNRAIGEHWSAKASDDAPHEILISPVIADAIAVFGVLVHELAHSATDGDGHRGRFPHCVKSLWLKGKPTTTEVGDEFIKNFSSLIESLGQYPHARLNVQANRKVQSTRMLKACCPACGYTVRISSKWIDAGLPICPVDSTTFVV